MRTIPIPPNHSAKSIAQACGVGATTIYQALAAFDPKTGVHLCSGPLAAAIHHTTGGAVTCWELRPDLWANGQVPPAPHVSSYSSTSDAA